MSPHTVKTELLVTLNTFNLSLAGITGMTDTHIAIV